MENQNQVPQRVTDWLNAYKGSFEFYVSVREYYRKNGTLSDKQIAAIERAVERENKPVQKPVQFSMQAGDSILLKKRWARDLAEDAGLTRPHFVFEIVEVLNETPKAMQLRLKLSAQRTDRCCVCGLHLTDPQSVIAGIGPICAAKHGVSHGNESLAELTEVLKTTEIITTWLPKSVMKEKYKKDDQMAKVS